MKTGNVAHWWGRRSKVEKTAIVAVGGVAAALVTAATAKAIINGGLVVVSGKTLVACGKAATIAASRFRPT